jgi:hypothetical protein
MPTSSLVAVVAVVERLEQAVLKSAQQSRSSPHMESQKQSEATVPQLLAQLSEPMPTCTPM